MASVIPLTDLRTVSTVDTREASFDVVE